jgi:hypothetical protein
LRFLEVKIDAQKGALRLEEKMTIDVLVTLWSLHVISVSNKGSTP